MVKGKNILITGGLGFIGSWLVNNFYSSNNITVFDNGRRNAFRFMPKSVSTNVNIIKGDITDFKTVTKITKDKDIVLHLAAIAGASFYEKEPLTTIDVNFFGTSNLLKSLTLNKVEQVIIFSSSEVYGAIAKNVNEEDPTCVGPVSQGRWSYAVSKLASEHLSFAYFKKYKLPIVTIRPFNIYGPLQVGEGAVANMIKSSIEGGKIYVTGDGSQKRSWCYISDLVKAVELICQKEISGECFNIGNNLTFISILELAKKIRTLNGKAKLIFEDAISAEIKERLPNIGKAKKILGFTPSVGLDEGLRRTYDWVLENIDRFKS